MLRASQLVRVSATTALRASAHTPMIRFPDRRAAHPAGTAGPHPCAPPEAQAQFDAFEKTRASGPHFDPAKVQSFAQIFSSGKESKSSPPSAAAEDAVEDLHQLPKRYWATPTLEITEAEMEAVNVRPRPLFLCAARS